ncbi:MAG TPA: hypothetical protein EYN79_06225 [Planctomycetes bacterium]|nr:hypothetical protein [Planctomycetota bacterium]
MASWWRRRHLRSVARRELAALFDDPSRLEGTSLKAAHRGRVDIVEIEEGEGELAAVVLGILRHPRPHPFSPQHHRVVEWWRFEVPGGRPERAGSVNLSRRDGRDGEPPGGY